MKRVTAGALQVSERGTRVARVFRGTALVPLMAATVSAQQPGFVPGQVLARFVPGSDASALVVRVAERQPLDLTGLTGLADRLGEGAGVPLKPTGLGSGHFCTFSLDTRELGDRLARRLRERQRVERVEVSPDTATITLTVAFSPGSEESRMRPARLVASLERELGVPLAGEASGQGRIVLHVNLEALTLTLVERVKALPDIESAQPNFVMKGFVR